VERDLDRALEVLAGSCTYGEEDPACGPATELIRQIEEAKTEESNHELAPHPGGGSSRPRALLVGRFRRGRCRLLAFGDSLNDPLEGTSAEAPGGAGGVLDGRQDAEGGIVGCIDVALAKEIVDVSSDGAGWEG
jgi:hypothetical protein